MSFRLKIILSILLVQALMLLVVVWSNFQFLRTSNEVELSKHAFTTSTVTAALIKRPVLGADLASLRGVLNDILVQSEADYIRVTDERGVIMELGNPDSLARPFAEDFLVEDVEDGVFDVEAEITDEGIVIGMLQMGFSTDSIESVMIAARRQTATISVIAIVIGLLIAIMLGNYFARQLKMLRDATRRIASGDVGYQLSVIGEGELAQTARAFNTMSRRLAALYSEKQAALNETKDKAAELRESKRRIQAVVNNALDGIITIDEQGIIESFNPAAEKMFGYEAEEVIGQNVNMLMPEPYHSEHDRFLREYLLTGEKKIIGKGREVLGRRKDGATFTLELDVSEVRIEGANLFIGIVRDVTERKHAEQELKKARDAILESSRNKFEFIANIGHEIRSPLDKVLGESHALLDAGLNSEQEKHVRQIQEAGKSLLTIINDVLDFSKIEAAKLRLEDINFDLQRTLYFVTQMLRKAAAAKKLNLVYLLPCDLPMSLRGDPARLRQVLVNLVDNAIKFTSRGEVVILVSKVDESVDGITLRFAVRDTGVGLSREDQQRIFESFMQVGGALTQRYGGTGLGLAISKQLVEMMGGEIGVESTQGVGSEFWFTAHFTKRAELPGPRETSYGELRDVRALVVDDSETVRKSMQHLLESVGMQVRAVADGARALEKLCTRAAQGEPYQVMIFNRTLPGMSGLQLARTVNSDDRLTGVRMIMLTSTGYRGDSEEVRRVGIRGYLTTPVHESQLLECVSAVVQLEEDADLLITRHNLAAGKSRFQNNVLLFEPDINDQKVISGMLQALDYSVCVACNKAQAINVVQRKYFEQVFINSNITRSDVDDVIACIRSNEEPDQRTRIVALLPALSTADDIRKCLDMGFDETLVKPVDQKALRHQLGIGDDGSASEPGDTQISPG